MAIGYQHTSDSLEDGGVGVAEGPRLVEKKVGRQWLITSPDVEGLHVSHETLEGARNAVPGVIELLKSAQQRL